MFTRMSRALLSCFALFITLLTQSSSAAVMEDERDQLGYDAIINELNREAERPYLKGKMSSSRGADPFDTILFHGGLGMATLMQSVSFDDGRSVYLGQKGIQASFGIDLFSANWMAEGTARTFNESEDVPQKVSLQEFELKIMFKERLARQLGLRLGGGLSARYMNLHRAGETRTYTTPSGLASLGFDIFINDKVSFGADLNGRSAMITDTPDKNSIDATLRVDFHL